MEPYRPSRSQGFVGFVDVTVHEARDIQNICIYHEQDVYAKLSLTTEPESPVSTRTASGGGRNPVFDDRIRLNVRTAESAIRCEVWMLSRIRNYLGDQLLGSAIVPLSAVVTGIGKVADAEFPLSSTDLFHSPSGFVKLSIEYTGTVLEVVSVTPPLKPEFRCESDNVEFPDLKIGDENRKMVSEYLGIENTESLIDCSDYEAGMRVVDGFATNAVRLPVIGVDVEAADPVVVRQDIVDMYTKSMQQFTDSLAKMKLPMDMEDDDAEDGDGNASAANGDSRGAQKKLLPSRGTGSRVFYGSRAFF